MNGNFSINSDASKIITADTLEFNSFKVTAMDVIHRTSNLVFAIANFGLVLFDVVEFKVRKILCLIKDVRYDTFTIQNIVA